MNDEAAPPPKKLSDFKPLKRLELPDLGELDTSGLTIIVGPNSSGKTQLLRDIRGRTTGEIRDLVVATDLDLEIPDVEMLFGCLRAEGQLVRFKDDKGNEQYRPRTVFTGTGQASKVVTFADASNWHKSSKTRTEKRQRDEFFVWASTYFVSALFLENRLTALNPPGVIDFLNDPPQHDLHAFHLNDEAKAALIKESKRAFSKAVWSDASRGNILSLKIAEDGKVPKPKHRLSPTKMSKYRTMEDEGDGMKSYIAICISILLGRRPICIIDEPEMCLHPPQAYSLGQFIGEHGTSSQTATFVATHSSHVLRGVIQTAEKLKIVRLTKGNSGFHAMQVKSDVLADAMKKPTVRAETVLDGIFSQAVAVVEADSDRIVYQATWDSVGAELNFDIHFATVGGTGGIADTCDLYRVLGIPIAVVADLDVVADKDKIKRILKSLIDDSAQINVITMRVQNIIDLIRKLPPNISEKETRKILCKLVRLKHDWSKGTDSDLRSELNSLSNTLNRMRALKDGGLDALPEEIRKPLAILVKDLAKIGLFLVPYGELEWWLKDCGIKASKKKNKWAWANEAALYIRDNECRDDDVWGFVADIGAYLTEQVN